MTEKTCARRFAFSAGGLINYKLSCDLDEKRVRYRPGSINKKYWPLMLSGNRNEREALLEIERAFAESATCIGIDLTDEQVKVMEEMLSAEDIEKMRGIDDKAMHDRSGGWCYRDGWWLSFYAEGDASWPPISLEGIAYCSFIGDELPFERLESYIGSEVLHNRCGAFLTDVSHKVPMGRTRQIIERAIAVGIEAIDEVLWHGSSRLIKELDRTPLDKELSYTLSDDCFTVRYGNTISRACKLHERPSCERVFGRSHTFGQGSDLR